MKIARNILIPGLVAGALLLAGCLGNDGGSSGETRLAIRMKMSESAPTGAMAKGNLIRLRKLVVTLTSSLPSDAVIRDTILADTGAFLSNSQIDQTFNKRYAIVPLRHWTIVVKTLDERDSVVHRDSVQARNLFAGETRIVPLDLSARFTMFEVKFNVPDSIKSGATGIAQDMIITRFVMRVNGALVRDSIAPVEFLPSVVHTVNYDYIRAGTRPDVTLEFFGHSAGTQDTLLFSSTLTGIDPTVEQVPVRATYVGPGSGGTGGADARLMFNVGKVHTVRLAVDFQDTVAGLKAAPRFPR